MPPDFDVVADMYLIDFADDPDDRARRTEERAAESAKIRARYQQRIMDQAGLDEITAGLAMAALFDHRDSDGRECLSDNHPRLPSGGEYSRDAGFDCRCTWDHARQQAEAAARKRSWDEYRDSPEARASRAAHEAERAALNRWLAEHPGVEATQTTPYAPEQWEGSVDGHSFFFRERHDCWRLELDLEPDGRVARRVVGAGGDEIRTEPVELRSGTVIAEGVESDYGPGLIAHVEFFVATIRDHLTGEPCGHARAERFCPSCGKRVGR